MKGYINERNRKKLGFVDFKRTNLTTLDFFQAFKRTYIHIYSQYCKTRKSQIQIDRLMQEMFPNCVENKNDQKAIKSLCFSLHLHEKKIISKPPNMRLTSSTMT